MKKIVISVFILTTLWLNAQTKIVDKQEVYGTWRLSDSPFIVEGEAIVPTGKILTIEPGVVVKFKTGEERDYRYDDELNADFNVGFLRVNGKIIAKGTKKKHIRFIANGDGNWGNIFMENSQGNEFSYCLFTESYYMRSVTKSDNATGALTFINSNGNVSFCVFYNNGWTAINCKQESNPTFNNLTIVSNNYGFECNSNSKPIVNNIILWNNNTGFYINGDSEPVIYNSCIQDEYLPEGCIDKGKNLFAKDPAFIEIETGNLNLSKKSVCKKNKIGANL